MFGSLGTAASGLQQFQQDINVIGNNIANVNTTGFKDGRADFADAFSVALGANPGNQVGSGVTTVSVSSDFSKQGQIGSAANPTDLAISGQGFFVVRNPADGSQYWTRAGNFSVDGNGYLITDSGLRVQGYNDTGLSSLGDIKIDATGAPATAAAGASYHSVSIDTTGTIRVTLSDSTQFVRGQVLLQNCVNPGTLQRQGDNLYTLSATTGALPQMVAPNTAGVGTVQSYALEGSNVDLTSEMTNLITAQRAFQANARMVTTSDDVLQEIINMKR